jgi:transposase
MQYEPLANYLKPHFGNIYKDELASTWTSELKSAVTRYVVDEAPELLYEAFLRELDDEVPEASRDMQAAFIIEHHEPQQVAHAFHIAAVKVVSTFQELMEELRDVWEFEDWKMDARYWLESNATNEQLREVARHLGMSLSVPLQEESIQYEDLADYLTDTVNAQRLLDVWEQAAASWATDLTDQEWALLEPFIPKGPATSKPPVLRQAINGMLWRHVHPGHGAIPTRYGRTSVIRIRRARYRREGVFARMLAGLQDKPEAERLVAWLREVVGTERKP